MTATVLSLASDPRFVLLRADMTGADFGEDVRMGLSAARKWLPPRWFYDALGSALFDSICFLPEYYVMRAEGEVFAAHHQEIVASFGRTARLVELGSGLARKTRILLDTMTQRQPALEYVPVDVDAATLERVGRDLLGEYDRLRVIAVCSDFTRPSIPLAALADGRRGPSPSAARSADEGLKHRGRTIVLFLGSTIGNLDPDTAVSMLRDLRSSLSPGDAFLLGADLRKPKSILEPAYNDSLGVTAAFNLNLLARINRELGGHFDLSTFRHRAFYDAALGRIEMHLISRRAQRVAIDALEIEVTFEKGEGIHTESSYKYDDQTLAAFATASGFAVEKKWKDGRGWFADVLMVAQ